MRKSIMSKIFVILTCFGLIVTVAACSGQKESGPDYSDDEAMSVISQGLEKRFAIVDQQDSDDNSGAKTVREAVNTELNTDKPLKDRQYENSKLQEQVIGYINVLEESLGVIDKYSYESTEYVEKWTEVYDKRTQILKTFVDDYGLKVSAQYENTLKDLVANGTSAAKEKEEKEAINKLISSAEFKKNDEGYDNYTYTAIVENTTEYSFENVSVVLNLYDKDGVKQEAYANVNSWAPGETVRFEAYSQCDAQQIKPTVQYYSVAD